MIIVMSVYGDAFLATKVSYRLRYFVLAIINACFKTIFIRCEAPMAATYRWFAALISLLALPPLISVFNFEWDTVWRWKGAVAGPLERGYMLHLFMTFVVVMAVIVGFLYLVTARYYRNAPPSLKSEIRRLEKEKA